MPAARARSGRQALALLGRDRLLAFLRAAAASGDCAAVRYFLEHVDAGKSVEDILLTRDDYHGGGYELSVTPIAGNQFEVLFGYASGMVGDGGSWTVDFDDARRLTELVPGYGWIV